MSNIDIYNISKEKVGEIALDEAVFGVEVREHLLYEAVRYQQARNRAGTHAVKRRADVRGGGKKPFRQKGTGRARQGTPHAAQMRGGGVVFGPEPRDHGHKMNKRARRAALVSALSRRAEENAILVLDGLDLPEARTKQIVEFMKRFELSDMLVVLPESTDNVALSARNLPGVTVLPSAGLNVYDVLHRSNLVITRDAVDAVVARLGSA